MKRIFILMIALCLFSGLLAREITPIATIQENIDEYNEQVVTIQGVITIGAGKTNDSMLNAFIQDDSGKGLELFDFNITSAYENDLIRGNELEVTGTIAEHEGITEIKDFSYEVLSSDNDIPVTELTIAEAQDYATWESTFVKVEGTIYDLYQNAGPGDNVNIADEFGDQITVRVWHSTGIDTDVLEENMPIKAYGIISFYNSFSQVTPGYNEDIQIALTDPQILDLDYTSDSMEAGTSDYPLIDEEITVNTTIVDYDGTVEEVKMLLKNTDSTLYEEVLTSDSDDYTGVIPSAQDLEIFAGDYYVEIHATDDEGNISTKLESFEIVELKPNITNISIEEVEDGHLISANISDNNGTIESAELRYTKNYDDNYTLDFELVDEDNNKYEALIPTQNAGTVITFKIYAVDNDGLVTLVEEDADGNELKFIVSENSSKAILRVEPKPFNPYENEKFSIDYFANQGDRVIIRIFDSEGKLLFTPVNGIVSDSHGQYKWDGRDKKNKMVSLGLYICHLEVTNVDTGKKKTDKAPIVVGDKLN